MSDPAGKPALDDAFAYCLSTLRDLDRDRYLACLLMSEPVQRDMAALYLFNAEIARVRDLVRELLPGEIRLQWWRDLFEKSANGEDAGPLAAALFDVIRRHKLPRNVLSSMCEARVFDLYDDPMPARHDFEGYAGETASALIQLGLMIAAPASAQAHAEAAGHAGVAQAVAGALLLMPRHAARGQVYLPLDMLAAAGLDRDAFLARTDRAKLDPAIEIFASFGLEHLDKARAHLPTASEAFSPFLPVALTRGVLARALKVKSGVFSANIAAGPLGTQWRLWRASRTRSL
ncbi:phytoene/squalene synthase family protein [Rhizobium sp. C4]|nr:phytoene/squalene synthase family protein [Rhizobium sp. C4]MCD2175194.1 phytoene/squalene synthase family protein [Rhizobium sp. C4]